LPVSSAQQPPLAALAWSGYQVPSAATLSDALPVAAAVIRAGRLAGAAVALCALAMR